ncbi:type I 3-dehydroquinate dehydratase [Myxococcota bacterium]|nr:type I 3-dehydroquinate dehydratase [Myxococcota bacterium]MBU1535123.1 type I 3-dehydroquinate dehydratase [Myxococcota bacterium]
MVDVNTIGTIVTGNETSLVNLTQRFSRHSGFHELRADLLTERENSLWEFIAAHGDSLLFTLRSADEGGGFDGSSLEKMALLVRALRAGAAMVDVELSFLQVLPHDEKDAFLAQYGHRVMVSRHLMEWDLPALEATVQGLAAVKCQGAKLALFIADAAELVHLSAISLPHPLKIVVGMGFAGLITRLRPSLFGSDVTFAPLDEKGATLAFQPTLSQLAAYGRYQENPWLLALAGGAQIRHSPGLCVYNALYESRKMPWQYGLLPTARASQLPVLLRSLGIKGISVTMPLKAAVAEIVEAADEWVEKTGVCNTVLVKGDSLMGYNTDARAFSQLAAPGQGETALILGSGSTAGSAFYALGALGYRCRVAGRTPPLHGAMKEAYIPWNQRTEVTHQVLVNTTPFSLDGPESVWPWPVSAHTIFDLALVGGDPFPAENRPGQRRIGGFEFWCHQGALQMTLLTGAAVTPAELLALGKHP